MFSEEIWMELRALHRHGWGVPNLDGGRRHDSL